MTKVKTRKIYQILSPDGLIIENQFGYLSMKEAIKAFDNWKKKFEPQGYYSSVSYGRIPLNELADYCSLIKV